MPIGGTAFAGQNQSPRLTTNYLNQVGRKGDPAPGVPVSTAQVSGSIVQSYSGQIGGVLTITNPFAPQFNDPAVGTYPGPGNTPPLAGAPLFGGLYQYVQFDPNMSVASARGSVAFWLDELNYIVTTNSTTNEKVAGIIINQTLAGNWDFIQISGIASVLFGAAGAGALLAPVGVSRAPGSNSYATAAAGTNIDENYLGIAIIQAPANATVSPVELNMTAGRNY